MNFDFRNGCENEFKDNYEKSCIGSRKRILTKSILKVFGRAKAMPTRWEVKYLFMNNYRLLFPLTAVGLTSVMYI